MNCLHPHCDQQATLKLVWASTTSPDRGSVIMCDEHADEYQKLWTGRAVLEEADDWTWFQYKVWREPLA